MHSLQDQILLNGVNMHLWYISKTNCIIWVEMILKQIRRIELTWEDRMKVVHEIVYSDFNQWRMANRTCSSSFNCIFSNNNMRWNFIRLHYDIFIIVIMDIQLLMDGIKRYIDCQTMNGNGLKSERFQKVEMLSESHHWMEKFT